MTNDVHLPCIRCLEEIAIKQFDVGNVCVIRYIEDDI